METEKSSRIMVALMQRGGRMYTAVLPETIQGRFWFEGYDQKQTQIPVSINARNHSWYVECEEGANIYQEGKPLPGRKTLLPADDSHGLHISFDDNQQEPFVLHIEKIADASMAFSRYEIAENVTEIRIGRDQKSEIYYQCPYVSEIHSILKKEKDGWYIYDNNSTNGTYVNGISLYGKKRFAVGDLVYIMGLNLVFGGSFLAINKTGDVDSNPTCIIDGACLRLVTPESQSFYLPLPRRMENGFFIQYPRRKYHLEAENIEIHQPPMSMNGNTTPLLMRLASPLLMGGRSLASGNVSMALSSMVLPFMTQGYSEKEKNEYNEKRIEWYAQYCLKKAEEIKKEKEREETELEKIHPSMESLLKLEDKSRLWEFRYSDPDFLQLRIGTQISMPMVANLQWPKDEYELPGETDPAKKHLNDLKEDHYDLTDVPALISLKQKFIIGILSQSSGVVPQRVAVNLITRLALTHGYDDLKIIILAAPEDTAGIRQYIRLFRYLPHCWDGFRETRFIAETQEDVLSISNYIKKAMEEQPVQDDASKNTAYVVFAFSRLLLDSFGILKSFISDKLYRGISVISAFDSPLKESQMLIRMEGEKKGKLIDLFSAEDKDIDFRIEAYDADSLASCMKTLFHTKLQVDGKAFSLPKSYSFMEMLNIGKLEDLNLADNWIEKHNPKVSLAAPIGIGTHGELVYLDLHQKSHGPHGLIAGTTGSGKSEFIITYILSLAVNFSPDEVAFVLIDYKGGGLVDAFVDSKPDPVLGEKFHLPHVLGTITNLDGSAIQRCLSSLQAELTRRQQKFRDAMAVSNEGKMEIYEYQKLYRAGKVADPIPHLFLIADEFAELKQKEPEFMETLVSIARIGRSLGVHLILATQKPSGVVNEQIWSNTRFRVCLKVQDRSDSQEMLKRPEAAAIKDIGRFYLQVGQDEIFTLGQSAYCGAEYHPSDKVQKQVDETVTFLDSAGQARLEIKPEKPKKKKAADEDTKSQLVATVTYLSDYIKDHPEYHKVTSIWLPSLADQKVISFDAVTQEWRESAQFQANQNGMPAILGRIDDPSHIVQFPLTVDLMEIRHMLICGTAGSGKSTLLFTLLYSLSRDFSPDRLQYYIFDCSSGILKAFEAMPHCGAYIHNGGEDEFQTIFSFLEEKMKERRKLFEKLEVNNFREYQDHPDSKDNKLPMILFVIDSYSKESVGIGAHTSIYQFVREAALFGIQIVLTANTLGEIYTKMQEEMNYHLALHASDKYAYQDILGIRAPFVPIDKPGHGMCVVREAKDARVLEWKAAVVAGETEEESRKAEQIRLVELLAQKYSAYDRAPFWKSVNEDQTYEEFCDTFDPGRFPLGFYKGSATATANPGDPIAIPLRQMGTMGVYFGSQQIIPQIFGNLLHAAQREHMQVTVIRRSSGSMFDAEAMKPVVSSLVQDQEQAASVLPEVNRDIACWFYDRFQERIRKWSRYKEQEGIVDPTDQQKWDFFKNHTAPWLIVMESGSDFYSLVNGVREEIWDGIEAHPDVAALTKEINDTENQLKQLREQAENGDGEAVRANAKEEAERLEQTLNAARSQVNERIQSLAENSPGLAEIEFFGDLIHEGIAHIMNIYLLLLSDRKEDTLALEYIRDLCPNKLFLFFGDANGKQNLAEDYPSKPQGPASDKPGSFLLRYRDQYYPMFMPYQVQAVQYDDPDDAPIM